MPALLERAVAEHSDRPALSDDRETLTFRELEAGTDRAEACLRDAGVGPGGRVALVLPNSCTFVQVALAVFRCRASVFPINSGAQPREIARILEGTPVAAMIGTEALVRTQAPAGTAALAATPSGLAILRDRPGPPQAPRRARSLDPALSAYSSGTVTRPHLVTRTQENLWWEAENFYGATRLCSDDVILAVVPLSHAHGFGNALLASLRSGARLVLRERFHRGEVLDLLEREHVTVFPTVPFMLRTLTTAGRPRRWDLDALRWCISAGAPLPREVADAFRDRFGVTVRQLYGLTEAGSVTLNTASSADIDPTSVGTPLGTTTLAIVDPDGAPLPPTCEGEIVVHSDAAMGGRGAALHTHDRGSCDVDGSLRITGRTSLFINCAGNKVDPAEVEEALRQHPAVGEAAVFGVPTAHGEETVSAAVVLEDDCTAHALREHCRALLASYKVPRVIHLRDTLPRSALGKVLVGRLADEVASATHQ